MHIDQKTRSELSITGHERKKSSVVVLASELLTGTIPAVHIWESRKVGLESRIARFKLKD